jgi:hypothetical protein
MPNYMQNSNALSASLRLANIGTSLRFATRLIRSPPARDRPVGRGIGSSNPCKARGRLSGHLFCCWDGAWANNGRAFQDARNLECLIS